MRRKAGDEKGRWVKRVSGEIRVGDEIRAKGADWCGLGLPRTVYGRVLRLDERGDPWFAPRDLPKFAGRFPDGLCCCSSECRVFVPEEVPGE